MARLSPQQKKFIELLRGKSRGDILTKTEIIKATGWASSTVRTHVGKNALSAFIEKVPTGDYRLIVDPGEIDEDGFREATTQVRPKKMLLHSGDILAGEIGSYRLRRVIGSGAVGHVWEATSEINSEPVAVKVMIPRDDLLEPSRLADVGRRFHREAKNGRQMVHSNIVRYLDYGVFKGNPFLTMELARASLGSELAKCQKLDINSSVNVIRACLNGLIYIHGFGGIHRDIKPDNILVLERGYVLADLGIVRWGDLNPLFISAGTITRATMQLGSWYYMAPEQLSSPHNATTASDIYSLGVTWMEMLSGSTATPFEIGARRFPDPCGDVGIVDMIKAMLAADEAERPDAKKILDFLDRHANC